MFEEKTQLRSISVRGNKTATLNEKRVRRLLDARVREDPVAFSAAIVV